MSLKLAMLLNRIGFSVSHDGDRGWIRIEIDKKRAAIKAAE